MTKPLPILAPKQALQIWAQQHNITPAQFAKDTEYSYQHAWNILAGETDVTLETLGRIVIAYGTDSVLPVIKAFKNAEAKATIEAT